MTTEACHIIVTHFHKIACRLCLHLAIKFRFIRPTLSLVSVVLLMYTAACVGFKRRTIVYFLTRDNYVFFQHISLVAFASPFPHVFDRQYCNFVMCDVCPVINVNSCVNVLCVLTVLNATTPVSAAGNRLTLVQ